jgi:hypothetical protein
MAAGEAMIPLAVPPGRGLVAALGAGPAAPGTEPPMPPRSAPPCSSRSRSRPRLAAGGPRLEGLAWLEDRAGTLDAAAVAALPAAALTPLHGTASAGFGPSTRWLRATLVNGGPAPADALLVFEFPLVDELDLWLADGRGGLEHRRGGLARPYGERQVQLAGGVHVTAIRLSPGERRAVVVRVRSSAAGFLGLMVRTPEGFERRSLVLVFSGAGLGGLLVLVALAGRLALHARRPVDIHASLFLALQAVHVGIASGLASTVSALPPAPLAGAKAAAAGLSGAAGLAFLRAFLGTAERRPPSPGSSGSAAPPPARPPRPCPSRSCRAASPLPGPGSRPSRWRRSPRRRRSSPATARRGPSSPASCSSAEGPAGTSPRSPSWPRPHPSSCS